MDKKKIMSFKQFNKMGSTDIATTEALYVSYIKRSYGIKEDVSFERAKKIQQGGRKKQKDTRAEKISYRKKKEAGKYDY